MIPWRQKEFHDRALKALSGEIAIGIKDKKILFVSFKKREAKMLLKNKQMYYLFRLSFSSLAGRNLA